MIGWMLGFGCTANWELIPFDERRPGKSDVRIVHPGEEGYQDPYEAYLRYMKKEEE